MSFASISFLIFFLVVLGLLLLTKRGPLDKNGLRHGVLLAASYFFYGWWDWRFCLLMLLMTVVAYVTARFAGKSRLIGVLGVVFPLLVLGIFKYFNFFVQSFAQLFGVHSMGTLNIILPVGISFYTFQSLSYTIDVMRGRLPAVKSFLKLALYISFFPQLVAGPIVKATDFLPQLEENRNISLKNFETGIQIFLFGLFKKIVIADHLSVFVDDVFRTPMAFSGFTMILALLSYSIQIYFDFSGYSDMAVGSAKMMGYDLMQNFNIPYLSQNVTEFWKRWHISLSSWLMEYLYIPLGGNRKGKMRTYINLMLTMVLGGLWHGASWTFVFWGFLHGAALCIHKLFQSRRTARQVVKLPHKIFNVALTYGFVCICWAFFRADTVGDAFTVLSRIFVWNQGIVQPYLWSIVAILLLAVATGIGMRYGPRTIDRHGRLFLNGFYPVMDLTKFIPLTVFLFVAGLTLALAYTGASPFIYFQF